MIGVGIGRPRILSSAGVTASFVSATHVVDAEHPFTGVQAGDELLYFAMHNQNLDPPTLVGGWDEIVPSYNGTVAWFVGWRKTAVGGDTDPLPLEVAPNTRKRLAIYRGLQFKVGSATRNSANDATMIVAAKAAGAGEWGVAFCFSRTSQADMEPFLPDEASDLNGGTGFLRGETQGSNNSHALGDTGGLNAGWAEKQSAIASSNWVTAAFLLEPA